MIYTLVYGLLLVTEIIICEIEIPYNPSEEEMHLLTIIKKEKKIHIDDLVMRSGFAMSTISSILLNLEFAGQVIHLPGKIYTTN